MIDDALIVVPAFNEEPVISGTLAELAAVAPRVLVVDDGSRDDTARAAGDSGALVLRLATNLNYGGALQAGFRYAIRHTDFPFICTFDADGQHDPACLSSLLGPLRKGEADYVLGSRYLAPGSHKAPLARQAGARLFAAAASMALHRLITDPTTGMIAMTREVAKVLLSELFPQDYPDADVVIMLDRMGFNIAEVPVTMRPSGSGRSMHAGVIRPLYYMAKMSVSMLHLGTRRDLKKKRKEAQSAA